ncbi:3-oxoacid CoA-transferase subunit A [Pseudooceanicola nanhaiensis]|jgi:3-oxoadipate CoA-transferase alpha subunit|uniref:3-oxoadipate CoA-transferase subunit A n=1 Tax=Pseudooceanicola nanhaiensis TaxID=375761 RepID=A0A917WAW4_9RHOB|nr:3-oxoacid CoA-transferase subunit A [Pseudooceanicola nanhaiensis]GGL86965.1 3-oxoadipate CoA-transferase subunit A [Pseudooceanicola nanhaiensis]
MLDRRCKSIEEAMAGIEDGATVMISGFGEAGRPNYLIKCLMDTGVKDLTLVSNNAGAGYEGLAMLLRREMVKKLVCSFPRGAMGDEVQRLIKEHGLVIEVNPQGTLAERIRAAGCGIPAFFTPTAYGTALAEGKETREIDGKGCVLETALQADFALVKAHKADRWGNLTYLNLARNFSPLMAMAAKTTIVEADEIVELGQLEPNTIVTPGICVDRLVLTRPVADHEWGAAA